MKPFFKTLGLGLLAGAALLASAEASAQDQSPYYAGASWGAGTNYSLGCYGADCDHTTSRSGKLYGGYTLGSRATFGNTKTTDALELSVFRASGTSSAIIPGMDGYTGREHVTFTGIAAAWATNMTLNESLALNSRLGASYTHAKLDSYLSGPNSFLPSNRSGDRLGATFGLGLSYALNKQWALHADYDYLPTKFTNHLNMWSVGASYRF